MTEGQIHRLKQPCKNRGISIVDNKDGSATIDGQIFYLQTDAEEYLEKIPRVDFVTA